MKKYVAFVFALALAVMCMVSPAMASDPMDFESGWTKDFSEISVVIPPDATVSYENGETVYYNFVDPVTGYHYNYYNDTTQAFFRWRKNFVDAAQPADGEYSLLEEDGTLHVYWEYEFNEVSHPVNGKEWGNTFVIDGPAALIRGTAYIHNYYYDTNDYEDTSATYKIQVKKDGIVSTTAFSRTCNSNVSFFDNFTPNAGSTYYVVITPMSLGEYQKLSGYGTIYTYR